MHLVQQRLIKIFVASLEMNPSALHGTGHEHDSLRGKKINQYSIPLYFAASKFWNSFNCAILLQFIIIQAREFYWKIRHSLI